MAAPNNSNLSDEEELYRRVLNRTRDDFLVFDNNIRKWIPGNAALRFDPDLSVYLGSVMEQLNLSKSQIIDPPHQALVFGVSAGAVREEGFGVQSTPTNLPDDVLGQAHGSVWCDPIWSKAEFKRHRNRIRRKFVLVAGEIDK